jgi:hypothetical protein
MMLTSLDDLVVVERDHAGGHVASLLLDMSHHCRTFNTGRTLRLVNGV